MNILWYALTTSRLSLHDDAHVHAKALKAVIWASDYSLFRV